MKRHTVLQSLLAIVLSSLVLLNAQPLFSQWCHGYITPGEHSKVDETPARAFFPSPEIGHKSDSILCGTIFGFIDSTITVVQTDTYSKKITVRMKVVTYEILDTLKVTEVYSPYHHITSEIDVVTEPEPVFVCPLHDSRVLLESDTQEAATADISITMKFPPGPPQVHVKANPFSDRLQLSVNTTAEAFHIEILSTQGIIFYSSETTSPIIELPTASWPAGMYTICIQTAIGEWGSCNVVKQ